MTQITLAVSNDIPMKPFPSIAIVPCTADHIRELRETIREADRKEIESFGFSCAQGLWRSFRSGMCNSTALIDGNVAACWGVAGSFLGDEGRPWLLTSHQVYKISPLKFARIYQQEVRGMLSLFPVLSNYVDSTYDEAVRLLQIVGFTVDEPQQFGHGLFRRFWMENYNYSAGRAV